MRDIVLRALGVGQAFAMLSLAACVGTGEGVPDPSVDDTAPTTFPEIQAQIFDPFCAAQCHRGGAAPKGLSLEDGRSLKLLVNVSSVELPELMRVAPGRPEDSYLIVKVSSGDARRVGSRMPRGGPPWLSARQIRALKQWIRDGATLTWVGTSSVGPTVSSANLEWWDEIEEDEP